MMSHPHRVSLHSSSSPKLKQRTRESLILPYLIVKLIFWYSTKLYQTNLNASPAKIGTSECMLRGLVLLVAHHLLLLLDTLRGLFQTFDRNLASSSSDHKKSECRHAIAMFFDV